MCFFFFFLGIGRVTNLAFLNSVDLLQLVEEAVDGCWVGHRARTVITGDSGIGSLYSPPKDNLGSPSTSKAKLVETIVDIGYRSEVRRRVATFRTLVLITHT